MNIANLQPGTGTAGTIGIDKVCGIVFNGAASQTTTGTACTFSTPFRVGVHFDSSEAISTAIANADDADAYEAIENAYTPGAGTGTVGEGVGYNGFYLAYWQNTC